MNDFQVLCEALAAVANDEEQAEEDALIARLAAADALADAVKPLNHFLDAFKNEADDLALWFYSDGTNVITVGDFRKVANALRKYWEAK